MTTEEEIEYEQRIRKLGDKVSAITTRIKELQDENSLDLDAIQTLEDFNKEAKEEAEDIMNCLEVEHFLFYGAGRTMEGNYYLN